MPPHRQRPLARRHHLNLRQWPNANQGRTSRCPGPPAAADASGEATRWNDTADSIRAALLDQLWDGKRFVARSARFRALCERSGFAENFDAETGAGLRDRAYAWTASSYLILAAAHERRLTQASDGDGR